MADRNTIWREGSRIRATDGGGYGDMVSDAQIAQHAYDARSDDTARAFAKATLAIREFERVAARTTAALATKPTTRETEGAL